VADGGHAQGIIAAPWEEIRSHCLILLQQDQIVLVRVNPGENGVMRKIAFERPSELLDPLYLLFGDGKQVLGRVTPWEVVNLSHQLTVGVSLHGPRSMSSSARFPYQNM
jgi:hypothetical protein